MKRSLLAIFFFTCMGLAMASDNVVVPPGHKVVVVSPAAAPHISTTQSGPLVVDYGRSGDWRATNINIEALSQKPVQFIVVLQNEMIEALAKANVLSEFFAYWKQLKSRSVSAIWVLPLRASTQTSVIGSIHSVGYVVHASGPDGACYVEVHKPDGTIVVGVPGPAL